MSVCHNQRPACYTFKKGFVLGPKIYYDFKGPHFMKVCWCQWFCCYATDCQCPTFELLMVFVLSFTFNVTILFSYAVIFLSSLFQLVIVYNVILYAFVSVFYIVSKLYFVIIYTNKVEYSLFLGLHLSIYHGALVDTWYLFSLITNIIFLT